VITPMMGRLDSEGRAAYFRMEEEERDQVVCQNSHKCCGRCGCSHAVQPCAMLRCGGGTGVAPGAKTRGPLVRRTWRIVPVRSR